MEIKLTKEQAILQWRSSRERALKMTNHQIEIMERKTAEMEKLLKELHETKEYLEKSIKTMETNAEEGFVFVKEYFGEQNFDEYGNIHTIA